MSDSGITRRGLLCGMGGLVAASVAPWSLSKPAEANSNTRTTREFSIKGYNRVLLPRGHGQLIEITKPITRRYPSRDHCMQMMAFFSESSGLLIHTKDSVGYLSDWEILPGDKLRIQFYGPEPEIETQVIPPTIEAAAAIYKRWAIQQSWATKRRETAPELSLIAVAANPNLKQQLLSIRMLTEKFPSPMGAWITQWRRHGFDTLYPDYEPNNRQEFSALLSGLKKHQCAAFPYINALLWDDRLEAFSSGESIALRNKDGSLHRYSKKLPWLVYACPASEAWQTTIIQARRSLRDTDGAISSGIYLDMLIAAGPFLCFATGHGHEPGDPLAWQKGVRKILASIEGIIMSEGNAEIYIDGVDALLMHLFTDQPDTVPLWNLVYGNLTRSVGWQMPRSISPMAIGDAINRATSFGASCHGSPWMTHLIQEALLKAEFSDISKQLGGR